MAFNKRAFAGYNGKGDYCLDSEWSRINARFHSALGHRADAMGITKADAKKMLDIDSRSTARVCLALYEATEMHAESVAHNPDYLASSEWFEKRAHGLLFN